jgi:asparagine synthase (glutamine-hydrolysing)
MCGIWFYLTKFLSSKPVSKELLFSKFSQITTRGPDYHDFREIMPGTFFGFHRLSIMDVSTHGHQPFTFEDDRFSYLLICNGEIYEHTALREKYDLHLDSSSDCAVLLPLYIKLGIRGLLAEIHHSEFAFVIFRIEKATGVRTITMARDIFGVRPLFYSADPSGDLMACSELKGLTKLSPHVQQFMPSHFIEYIIQPDMSQSVTCEPYYNLREKVMSLPKIKTDEEAILRIRDALTEAIHLRMFADRPMCALVSGGVDSSLVFCILCKLLYEQHQRTDPDCTTDKTTIYAFTIGISESVSDEIIEGEDLKHAREVIRFLEEKYSDRLNIVFTEINKTYAEMWAEHRSTAFAIENFDITTNRASIGQYTVCKEISKLTDCKVVFNGDGSDEIFGGYLCFGMAPTPEAFEEGNYTMAEEIHFYDVARSDRGTSDNGLEGRVPFLDVGIAEVALSIDPVLKMHTPDRREKYLLRKAFDGLDIIPDSVLWRKKEAFSDGISSKKKGMSWFEFIQARIHEFAKDGFDPEPYMKLPYLPSPTVEAAYYRHLFDEMFGEEYSTCIPHYWIPLFQKTTNGFYEPSARALAHYHEE